MRGLAEAPVIETGRLRLRPFHPGDAERHGDTMADAGVVTFLGGKPFAREDSWRRILAVTGLWPLLGYGYWAVAEKTSDRFVGLAGFADFHRDMDPPIDNIPEMGWIFHPDAHGEGYATEAVRAGIDWADANLGADRYCCIIAPGNAASINVARKAGFTEGPAAIYRGEPTLLLYRDVAR